MASKLLQCSASFEVAAGYAARPEPQSSLAPSRRHALFARSESSQTHQPAEASEPGLRRRWPQQSPPSTSRPAARPSGGGLPGSESGRAHSAGRTLDGAGARWNGAGASEGRSYLQPQQRQQSRPGALQPGRDSSALQTGLALTWLGTNSGTPTLERNVSCTLVRLPGVVQIVDCGEGTHRQLMGMSGLELAEVDGIFVTHMHGDHCFGLGAALALLDAAKAERQTDPTRRRNHVYGPPGVAELLRASLLMTGGARQLQLPLTVTELVCSPANAHPPRPLEHPQAESAATSASNGSGQSRQEGVPVLVQRLAAKRLDDAPELQAAVRAVSPRVANLEVLWMPPRQYQNNNSYNHHGPYNHQYGNRRAAPDSDAELYSSVDEDVGEGGGRRAPYVAAEGLFWELPGCAGVTVRAAQLQHRVACWGYVFLEAQPQEAGAKRRKAVVMGDTVSSRAIAPLAAGCDVIAHEATFARGMEAKARVAQHSTGAMAGAFAAAIGARNLVLTHFSARYREAPRELESQQRTSRATGQREAEQQSWAVAALVQEAADTFGKHDHIVAASDYYTYHVPKRAAASGTGAAGAGAGGVASDDDGVDAEGDGAGARRPQGRALGGGAGVGGRVLPRRLLR